MTANAQEPPACKLRWFGQCFFRLETTLGKSIVFNPHDIAVFDAPQVTGDMVLISHEHPQHNQLDMVKDAKAARVFRGLKPQGKNRFIWNAINEKVGQVTVRSVGVYHDTSEGAERGLTTVFIVEADGLRFVHLGTLGHELSLEQVKAIGPVDVLMIPVGGVETINGDMGKKITAALKPRLFVVPMHFGVQGFDDLLTPEEFLDGPLPVKKTPMTNLLSIPVELKADKPTVVVLGWKSPAK